MPWREIGTIFHDHLENGDARKRICSPSASRLSVAARNPRDDGPERGNDELL